MHDVRSQGLHRRDRELSPRGHSEVILGKTDGRLGLPLSRVGEAELAANHPERAIEPLERALAIYSAVNAPPLITAAAMFPLARAPWSRPAARNRAIELARATRDAWAAGGAAYASRQASADAWLREHSH